MSKICYILDLILKDGNKQNSMSDIISILEVGDRYGFLSNIIYTWDVEDDRFLDM